MASPSTSGRFDLVLFDFDGTLVDSGEVIVAALRAALTEAGLDGDGFDHHQLRAQIGEPVPVLFPALGVPPDRYLDATSALQRYFAEHGNDGSAPFPGALDLLTSLGVAQRVVGLATAKPERTARTVIAHLGWTDHFTVIAGADDDESGGHKDVVIELALGRLAAAGIAVAPERTCMIGDRSHDMVGARHHGLTAIGVTWGFGSAAELEAAGADHIVDTYDALAKLLTSSDLGR